MLFQLPATLQTLPYVGFDHFPACRIPARPIAVAHFDFPIEQGAHRRLAIHKI